MSVGLVKDLTSAFEKAIAFRTGYNSEQIASDIETNTDCWCRLEDDSNLKWYLISQNNGTTVTEYYGYLSRMYPIAIMMENCPNKILKILFDSKVIVENYYDKYKCDEKILGQFVDKDIIDDCFLYNDKIPFNKELFNAIDEGVEYINPCGFRLEELLN